jgi:hypothetical protein
LKFCRLGNGILPGATQDTHISQDFSPAKPSSKKRWGRNPARRSWMNDFENETAAFVLLRGKSHPYSVPSDEKADFTFRFGLTKISMKDKVLKRIE